MNEREEWIQKYIQKQIDGMVFGSEIERQIVIQKAREQANMYLQMHQGKSKGNPKKRGEMQREGYISYNADVFFYVFGEDVVSLNEARAEGKSFKDLDWIMIRRG